MLKKSRFVKKAVSYGIRLLNEIAFQCYCLINFEFLGIKKHKMYCTESKTKWFGVSALSYINRRLYEHEKKQVDILLFKGIVSFDSTVPIFSKINWHKDINSGFVWSKHLSKFLLNSYQCDIADALYTWQLSRWQFVITLYKWFAISHNSRMVEIFVDLWVDWLKSNHCPRGINWTNSMEVAIRVCNWLWAWWAFREHPAWTDEFNEKFLKSVWQHGWYIEHNLENKGGIRTNHYLSDIVGLLFIGAMFPQFKNAERWKTFGVRELIRCMEEMVYPDGVSFENSTAYHRLVIELFTYSAIFCKRNDIVLPASFWQRLEKMFEFVVHCMRPDGRMPMIGDSDDGRFFILVDYYDWDRWDFRYLLSIGAVLFKRSDFKLMAGRRHEEIFWLFGEDGVEQYGQL